MHTNTPSPGLMHLILYSAGVLLLSRMEGRFSPNYHLFFFTQFYPSKLVSAAVTKQIILSLKMPIHNEQCHEVLELQHHLSCLLHMYEHGMKAFRHAGFCMFFPLEYEQRWGWNNQLLLLFSV